jgi:hypothetical protein
MDTLEEEIVEIWGWIFKADIMVNVQALCVEIP